MKTSVYQRDSKWNKGPKNKNIKHMYASFLTEYQLYMPGHTLSSMCYFHFSKLNFFMSSPFQLVYNLHMTH